MAGLKIDYSTCDACGNCINTCPVKALYKRGNKVALEENNCILCGGCIDSCPYEAISINKKRTKTINREKTSGIWVYAEHKKGVMHPVVYELLGKGRELADKSKHKLTAVLIDGESSHLAKELIAYGADRVILCSHVLLESQQDEYHFDAMTTILEEEIPSIFLFGATSFGRSLAPRMAARLQTGLTADCTRLEVDDVSGNLYQTRPAFGGNLMATILCPDQRPQMATVRSGIMHAKEPDYYREGMIKRVNYKGKIKPNIEIINEIIGEKKESIGDASVIISAGRGIGSQKNMKLVRKLADVLGGQVGVSRPLVDIGWSEYPHQIGQTGAVVRPQLMITCGISGAIQHLAGIADAKTIIAINTDPEAPIFSVANYKIIDDCIEVLKMLIDSMEKKQS
ncbi:electron transfer flavoprotein subunit alpha [Tindallia californiensis]|uniref:Electron transfer flavoprotein alpha subunit apoprotein n=1 Tax=Tindallia californiensis TaxID=159292 RepID=A0A1H3MY37_9FIRM|nr:electron transfer flavoprotein subunit alpha [Tindallia californiensis]SDY81135.1 electron transfer flavoprotein alpha subunit apoprotein [Tindallia californiensis]